MWRVDTNSIAGTTTDDYSPVLEWKVDELGLKTILLKNVDPEHSLEYRLSGTVSPDGIAKELVAETLLLPGEIAEFHYDRQWHTLVLYLIDGSGHAQYRVDFEGQGA